MTETDSAVCVELTPKATQGQGRSSKKSRSKQRRKHKRQTGHDDSGDEQPRVTGKAVCHCGGVWGVCMSYCVLKLSGTAAMIFIVDIYSEII